MHNKLFALLARGLMLAMVGLLLSVRLSVDAQAQEADPNAIWPNAQSQANSDDWLRLHHSQIRQMQPRLLVLNFVNGLTTEEATRKSEALMAALRESSRYHGYAKASAPAFLDYKIFKVVDLTDGRQLTEDVRFEGNSSRYPRTPDWKEGMVNFQYAQLFDPKFAALYKIPDPNDANRLLTLTEMVNKGLVNEVWFIANTGKFGAPLEEVEVKQAYDINMRKIPGRAVQAGLNSSDQQPFVGRSLRILWINPERGPGLALTALGRGLESMALSNAVPYFSRYFADFAGFDLRKRYGLPFNRIAERGSTEFDFADETTLNYVWQGERRTLRPYIPVGGNAIFPPTARRDFDLNNQIGVQSTIEHYRLFDGPDGKDRPTPWSNQKFQRYQGIAPDGTGPWIVYWRQNMPGLDNPCKDDQGKPMLNWWPFLFY